MCFFAVTKYCSGEKFRLLVGLSDAKMVTEQLKALEKEKYVTEFSQKTSDYLVKPGTKFRACLNPDSENSETFNTVSLVYHRDSPSYQDFVVTGKEHDFVKVTISMNNKKPPEENDNIFTLINVELLLRQDDDRKHSSSLQFTGNYITLTRVGQYVM